MKPDSIAFDPALLVFNTSIASAFSEPEKLYRRRFERFYLQSISRDLLPEERVSDCIRKIIPGKPAVDIMYSKQHERAQYNNLFVCGSLWMCPVCAAKISERRRVEMATAIQFAKAQKLNVFMVTVTFQHTREDKLFDLAKVLNEAYRQLKSGRWWQEFQARWQVVGVVTGTEITYGLASGFHPHKHAVFFSERPIARIYTQTIENEITERWCMLLEKQGYYASQYHAVDVRKGDDNALAYVSKMGKEFDTKAWGLDSELTKGIVKKSKDAERFSPFQLLDLYANGVEWAGYKFQEYAYAMKGKNQLTFSPGLRDLLGIGADTTDQEIAEAPIANNLIVLASIPRKQWASILKRENRAMLLEVASTGDVEWLKACIDTLANLR